MTKRGFYTISMEDDFATIYGQDVKKLADTKEEMVAQLEEVQSQELAESA